MKIEILLAMMFFEKEDPSFLENMNIETDMIVGNQTDYNEDKVLDCGEHRVTVLSRNERGVGKNRNICLSHSSADVVLFADNDVRYYDGYSEKIQKFYQAHPDADVVIFNFKEQRGDEPLHDINTLNKKASLRDVTKFGTWAVSARREKLLEKGITFSLLFGGGAKYGSGEDSKFLVDCCRSGLSVYLSDDTLGEVIHRESTWYRGVTEKYIFDKGAFFKALFPKSYLVVVSYHVFKHRRVYAQYGGMWKVLKLMRKGAADYESCKNL